MKKIYIANIFLLLLIAAACKKPVSIYDASGTFEAEETIISSEATGVIRQLDLEEGQQIKAGQLAGYIDTTQLYLRKKQLNAQVRALLGKKPDIPVQLASLQEQLKAAQKEQKRISGLVNVDAATPKQLDDANAQISVLQKQISAQQSSLGISSTGFNKDAQPFIVQIEQVDDQLLKSRIINPVDGTVLTKYAEANEMATPGKPLYKIGNLTTLIFRAYITGDQLGKIKLNQPVAVYTDDGNDQYKQSAGTITWISDKAEFTPKTIMTQKERASTVYAIKINVPNDGSLKIGMYGELKFGS